MIALDHGPDILSAAYPAECNVSRAFLIAVVLSAAYPAECLMAPKRVPVNGLSAAYPAECRSTNPIVAACRLSAAYPAECGSFQKKKRNISTHYKAFPSSTIFSRRLLKSLMFFGFTKGLKKILKSPRVKPIN